MCKQKIYKLHQALLDSLAKEQAAASRVAALSQDVEEQKRELERLLVVSREHDEEIQALQESMRDKEAEIESSADAERLLKLQIDELEKERKSLEGILHGRREEIRESFGVLIEAATAEMECTKKEVQLRLKTKENLASQRNALQEKETTLKEQLAAALSQVEGVKRELDYTAQDPERVRVQADQFSQVLQALKAQTTGVEQELEDLVQKAFAAEERLKVLESQREEVSLQVTVKRDEVLAAELAERAVLGKAQAAKVNYLQAAENKRALDLQSKDLASELKMVTDMTSRNASLFDRAKVEFKKAVFARDAVFSQLPDLKSLKTDWLKEKKQLEIEIAKGKATESDRKERGEEADLAFRKLSDLEKEAAASRGEVESWAQHVKTLTAHKERILREIAAAQQRVTDGQQRLQIKYITLKQTSDQQVAEMTERHKILANEVEILRLQAEAKAKAIEKRSLQMQKEVEQRGWLRLEQSRLIQKVKEESRLMEEYVIEIDRLNNVINAVEKEMLSTKRIYQTAIESRNLAGIQLIDRQAQDSEDALYRKPWNDELCLLWEKSNMLEETEKRSQRALHEKDQDVTTLRLQLQEVERQLHSKKRRAKDVPVLAAEVEKLKKELQEEKRLAESISRKLENPTEGRQWQELGGEDPDMETLEAKYRVIEQRFRGIKKELIDQDLRLEDLTELTDKQKARAEEERADAIRIRNEILRLHGKLIEMNRRMKVTMSELTLYQEYLPRLKQLQAETAQKVDEARENVYFGRPATPNTEEELAAMLKKEVARNQILYAAKERALEEEREGTSFLRTTAERRPTQYFPDDGSIGLPVAYGANAPFKPGPPTSNLRHYKGSREELPPGG
ncbi:conserved hypothetical protein [Neospora caninum Liverpool]|uniref:Uncharacterized protein n=1 Tax=Neospora caninum (strain Liverpool) TaxID=572307 RepID=F0VE41_NEOCL|nr:conserved hypothetical protein [Neospora caninum Liverpool]CBZ51984.1 conserved hypothetical protein [Neospora caninum Liverpool]|eukprot:XP_003882017.1 conserved hypothetical protein [Neospora caninum Liverpool]